MCANYQNDQLKFALKRDRARKLVDRLLGNFVNICPYNSLFMHSLPSSFETQMMITSLVNRQDSLCVLRFGLFEYILCYQYLEKANNMRSEYTEYIRYHIQMDTGLICKSDTDMDRYAECVLSRLSLADVIAYWRNIPNCQVFSNFYNKDVKHINVEQLYPFPFWHKDNLPIWQKKLENKNVLVVSAFADTVLKQYHKKNEIWQNTDVLPQFNLKVYKAVQMNGGKVDKRFNDWFEAVEFMVNEILQIDFDIALISCGGYGIPLSLELKKKCKKVIQWGGCFQLWFGILGNRWAKDNRIRKFVNDSWTTPSDIETPPMHNKIDNSAYW